MENAIPQLQDIHLPASPGIWPLALGWWVLLTIVIFLAIWFLLKLRRQAKLKKQRDMIFSMLDSLEEKLKEKPGNEVIAEINTLMRQLAINYYPRAKIASLTGAAWLNFLDHSGKTKNFSRGAGRILIDVPYQPMDHAGALQNFNQDEFIPLVRRWVKRMIRKGEAL